MSPRGTEIWLGALDSGADDTKEDFAGEIHGLIGVVHGHHIVDCVCTKSWSKLVTFEERYTGECSSPHQTEDHRSASTLPADSFALQGSASEQDLPSR